MSYIPLISSGVAGPLGAIHLPRLWQKASLEAVGKLNPDYPGIGKGYDSMVIAALGLNEAAVRDFIKSKKPSYTQFEAWVKAQPGAKVDKASIDASNAAIRGYNHDDATRGGIFGATGLTDESCSFRGAIDLNNLDDWAAFHKEVLS
jgi:hypothetical protein